MITIEETFKKVREENLTKTELEHYRNELANLLAQLQLELADLEKEEALFLNGKKEDESVIARKVAWKATPGGQRLITLKRYSSATKTMLGSLKDRLYLIF